MNKLLGLSVAVVLMFGLNAEAGLVFTDNFDMRGNYTQYLYSSTNAKLDSEAPAYPDVTYWAPTQNNVWADIEYRYYLGFEIGKATIYANLQSYVNYDPGSQAYLDVSADGVNWKTVEQSYVENRHPTPIDISNILEGSTTAYVRARLFETTHNGSIAFAQFLRTTNDTQLESPNVYQFQAEATAAPEPSTIVMACTAIPIGFFVAWRSRRRKKSF